MPTRFDSPTLAGRIKVSFEFFPPKNGDMEGQLWESISRLAPFNPDFVSVTYGAGGSTKQPTLNTISRIIGETDLAPAAHLTCVDATREDVDQVALEFAQSGVKHFVALRGDPSEGVGAKYRPHPGGYENSAALVRGLRELGDFEISVAAYPEKHPESPDFALDIDLLKRKVDAGATRALTQFFYDNDAYERYVERVRKAGIFTPIVPGIMLQPNFKGLKRISGLCGSSLPGWLHELYDGLDEDTETRELVTANVAADLCRKLSDEGVRDFHFYTLNRAGLALSTCRLLGLKPNSAEAA